MRSIAPGASSRMNAIWNTPIASTADSTSITTSVFTSMPRHFTRLPVRRGVFTTRSPIRPQCGHGSRDSVTMSPTR